MNANLILAVVDGALRVLEKIWPEFVKLGVQGEISVEAQAEMTARINRLRVTEAFSGPEWEVSKN